MEPKIQNNYHKLKEAYISYLETLPWTFFLTGSTRYELTLKSVRRLAERFYQYIKNEDSRFFWVAEKFELKDGYHMHGLLSIPNKYEDLDPDGKILFLNLVDQWQRASGTKTIITKTDNSISIEWDKSNWNALNLKKYDKKRGAGGYCAKYVFKNDADYDLL